MPNNGIDSGRFAPSRRSNSGSVCSAHYSRDCSMESESRLSPSDVTARQPVGSKNRGRRASERSGRTVVLVYEACEDLGTCEAGVAGRAMIGRFGVAVRWSLIERSMRPVPVVVGLIFAQDPGEMSLVEYQQAVQALAAQGADPPFGVAVRLRSPRWAAQYRDSAAGEHGVEAGRERVVAIADEKPASVRPLPRGDQEVCGPAGSPTARSDGG